MTRSASSTLLKELRELRENGQCPRGRWRVRLTTHIPLRGSVSVLLTGVRRRLLSPCCLVGWGLGAKEPMFSFVLRVEKEEDVSGVERSWSEPVRREAGVNQCLDSFGGKN